LITTGASVWVQGVVVKSQGTKQKVELKLNKLVFCYIDITVRSSCAANYYAKFHFSIYRCVNQSFKSLVSLQYNEFFWFYMKLWFRLAKVTPLFPSRRKESAENF
jgi:hypothetical protein